MVESRPSQMRPGELLLLQTACEGIIMDFQFTQDQEDFRERFRAFIRDEVPPELIQVHATRFFVHPQADVPRPSAEAQAKGYVASAQVHRFVLLDGAHAGAALTRRAASAPSPVAKGIKVWGWAT